MPSWYFNPNRPRHNNNNPRSRPEFKFYLMLNVQNINKLFKTYATVFSLHKFFNISAAWTLITF